MEEALVELEMHARLKSFDLGLSHSKNNLKTILFY
jgi:hypothetical protein